MLIYGFDVETIPNRSLPASCIPVFDPESIKYGNTKDPVKRAEKEQDERKKFDDGLVKKMSVDPALCQTVTFVGIKYDTEAHEVVDEDIIQLYEDDEDDDLEIIETAWEGIQSAYRSRIPVVTFNGMNFDLQVLLFRAMLQDVPIDRYMFNRLIMRYSNQYHYDLKQILANWDKNKYTNQEFYWKLFRLGDKSEFDGSMVNEAYKVGEFDRILTYCRAEVLTMCELFARIEPWIKIAFEGAEEKDIDKQLTM
uniref:Putative DNA polymerase n=1 Tax=viral metagenome TaxID=1070528 RepID=A0A6H1ZX61_9ZZZZ